MAGDGEGGITRRFGERCLEGEAAGEIAGEAADEGVAGAGRVDRLDLDRGDALRAAPCRQQRTAAPSVTMSVSTPRFTRFCAAAVISSSNSTGMSVRIASSNSSGMRKLRLRDDVHVEVAAGRRWVQHSPHAVLAREANRFIGGFKLNLELQQDEIATLERLACGLDVG